MIILNSFSLLLSLLLAVPIKAQSLPTPSPVQEFAFARAGSKLYMQGGKYAVNNTIVSIYSQFFSLDLATNWSVSSPPWQSLAPGLNAYFIRGVATPDNKTFIVFQEGNNGSVIIPKYDIPTNTWSPTPLTLTPDQDYRSGVIPVIDPTTGLVYLNAYQNMDVYNPVSTSFQVNPNPPNMPASRFFGGGVYIKPRHSILYFGGSNASIVLDAGASRVTEYSVSTGTWTNFTTTGEPPSPRSDFCMTASEDGNTVVVYGGRVTAPTNFSSSLYILDVPSGKWTQGPDGTSCMYMACIIVGDQFLTWGGSDGNNTHTGPPAVFSLTTHQWVNNYTAPSYYAQNPTVSPGASTTSSSTLPSNSSSSPPPSSSSSNLGAILGGVFGGLLVIALSGVIFIYLKRKESKGEYSDVQTSEKKAGGGGNQGITPPNDPFTRYQNPAMSETSSSRGPQALSAQEHRLSTPIFSSPMDSELMYTVHRKDAGLNNLSNSPAAYDTRTQYSGSDAGVGVIPTSNAYASGQYGNAYGGAYSAAPAYPDLTKPQYDYSVPAAPSLSQNYQIVPGTTLAPAVIDTTTGQVYMMSTPPPIISAATTPSISTGITSNTSSPRPVTAGYATSTGSPQSPQGLPIIPQRPAQNGGVHYSSVVSEVSSNQD
ncbi:hypothetical protein BGX26_006903 [Mortierella sp. AD094]|nr:hypothetical protein BGX26_006903 [Mortierella sp. AD094]